MFCIECPNCGLRDASEFRFGGEVLTRPQASGDDSDWAAYVYLRTNSPGVQSEWWYHRMGCQRWFLVQRNKSNNQIMSTSWPRSPSKRSE